MDISLKEEYNECMQNIREEEFMAYKTVQVCQMWV